ncbi:MAG: NosD domain-containing protein [Promethearchaeota archaeon]
MITLKKSLKFKNKILLVLILLGFTSILINLINYDNSPGKSNSEFSDNDGLSLSARIILPYTLAIDNVNATGGFISWEIAVSLYTPYIRGNGTWGNPYILENITITNGNFIIIRNSQVPLIIRNCIVTNSSIYEEYAPGIQLNNVDNGQILDNNCSNSNKIGIFVIESNNNTFSGNNLNNNKQYGIFLYESDSNIILGNSINYNELFGIMLYRANYNHIEGNELIYNYQGCIAEYFGCTGNVKINNICKYDFEKLFFSPIGIMSLVAIGSLPIVSAGLFLWHKKSAKSER